jgi:hypothetical protein
MNSAVLGSSSRMRSYGVYSIGRLLSSTTTTTAFLLVITGLVDYSEGGRAGTGGAEAVVEGNLND